MLPVSRYKTYGYPPSDKFVGFGDDVLTGAVQAHDSAYQSLFQEESGNDALPHGQAATRRADSLRLPAFSAGGACSQLRPTAGECGCL